MGTALLTGQITTQSGTLELISLPNPALCLQWMCTQRDEPEGFCGGGSEGTQWDGSEGKAAQTQGKVPELGRSQLAWKALGMEAVAEGQQEGAWVRSWWNTGRAGCSLGLQPGSIPGNEASLEKHRVPCADLLIPPWRFLHLVWS